MIEIESFNMGEGTCLSQSGNGVNRRTRSGADNHLLSAQDACAAIRKRDLNRFWSDKASRPHEEVCPLVLKLPRCMSTSPSTIFRLRSRTTDMWIWVLSLVIPNSSLLQK